MSLRAKRSNLAFWIASVACGSLAMTEPNIMPDITKQDKKIYSVSEITRDIRLLIENAYGKLWIEGEITGYRPHSSGHYYFNLKDSSSVLNCAFFKNAAYRLKFKLEDGMKVVCHGRISVYEPRGQYQLIVEEIEPKGIGSLQMAFEQLKARLSKEGLFDESHKVPIPYLPERIGIVTSPTGAVIRDMLHVLDRRFPEMPVVIYPAKVQGESAAEEIAEGIKAFNKLKNVDVIIIGRGGGSPEDLWAFNEEAVARAIYASDIPIISAVGHEIDYTIADFVADRRAPTPSAAAEIVVQSKEEMLDDLDGFAHRIRAALIKDVEIKAKYLEGIIERHAFRQPRYIIEQYQQRIDERQELLVKGLAYFLERKNEQLSGLTGKLGALNPTAILSRGYSITMTHPGGRILKDASGLKKGEKIKTRLAKGEVISEIGG